MEADYLINSAAGPRTPAGTLIVPERRDVRTTTTDKAEAKVVEVKNNWEIVALPNALFQMFSRPPIAWASEHPAVNAFVSKVAQITGVKCIVVEDVEGKIFHLSTFATPLTEETRRAIYEAEATLIDSYPTLIFDFHLRDAGETIGLTPIAIPGQQFFAVWGDLDANTRRAPQTGER